METVIFLVCQLKLLILKSRPHEVQIFLHEPTFQSIRSTKLHLFETALQRTELSGLKNIRLKMSRFVWTGPDKLHFTNYFLLVLFCFRFSFYIYIYSSQQKSDPNKHDNFVAARSHAGRRCCLHLLCPASTVSQQVT